MTDDVDRRAFVERLLAFDTTDGNEAPAQEWFGCRLDELGFETYHWKPDSERLVTHPSFPDDPAEIETTGRPNVAGVIELGSGKGPTLLLNGHADVVPAEADQWSSDPFEPTWTDETLTARGAADMKAGLVASVFAARQLAEADLDGRVVVESVVGEEAGGIGAAESAQDPPYPVPDAAIIAEPTDLTPVIATEGTLMKRLTLTGRSAHAATPWHGEDVLDHFERVRNALADLEAERARGITHPLYEPFPRPVPIVAGTVHAGSWASSVPAHLESEFRIGVAPGETVDEVEQEVDRRIAAVVADSEWLTEHPPRFERFSVQFEPAEISPEEPIVRAVCEALDAAGRDSTVRGATYGTDARHYIEAGIPTVVFGPGSIRQAHFPDESIDWSEVTTGIDLLESAGKRFFTRNTR
ncbi:ArgE/DapE family deacylase [Halalkalicoccus jeotgali]|uniref:Probable succinyl-diaminopimelate desuccinylase n=1 Tax=Halalkalicoccus jeotgali (strain DSM 18796 / CECT 7217 / JCM 14584 / KCTC 4019 / B3) TaxID=795797 RepID=D8J3R4_HALJB|nr:ArgE/DapE family deacylase [Halalkalicoccus jeotgali]ADJ13405.1 peptidase M20 [Halalkalicoccus jeotgali B3]ELY32763.1 peptidase M20 [Halalkalicoccus jeotgali B3]